MRKVTAESVRCFMYGEQKTIGNTRIVIKEGTYYMLLHGNCIAERNINSGHLKISHAGWQTATTKDRLNGILDYCKVARI